VVLEKVEQTRYLFEIRRYVRHVAAQMHVVERQMKDVLDAVAEIAGGERRRRACKVQRGCADSAAGHLVHLTHLCWLNAKRSNSARGTAMCRHGPRKQERHERAR